MEYETFVADNDDGETVGWIAMTPDGYIEMLFCLAEATKCGVGLALYAAVERIAVDRGLTELTAHASAFAESFFVKVGWFVRERETVGTGDAAIVRALMVKTPLQGDA
jgi:putative acetyltransferase